MYLYFTQYCCTKYWIILYYYISPHIFYIPYYCILYWYYVILHTSFLLYLISMDPGMKPYIYSFISHSMNNNFTRWVLLTCLYDLHVPSSCEGPCLRAQCGWRSVWAVGWCPGRTDRQLPSPRDEETDRHAACPCSDLATSSALPWKHTWTNTEVWFCLCHMKTLI